MDENVLNLKLSRELDSSDDTFRVIYIIKGSLVANFRYTNFWVA